MPIYDNDEHEYLSSRVKKLENNMYIEGNLFLTDKRIIFERKGKRSFIRASPAITDLNIFLYNVENATYAIPKFSLFTRKILSFEYYNDDKKILRTDFIINDPKNWVNNITRLASLSKREYAQNSQKIQEDKKKHELDMARAKAPRANIGMAIFGNKTKPHNNLQNPEEYVNEDLNENFPSTKLKCPNCSGDITEDMGFCPHCGFKLIA